jgi:hypothetical protein
MALGHRAPTLRGMTKTLCAALAASVLALTGCGGGGDSSSSAPKLSGPQQAVKDTILSWTFTGNCDAMTDNFLDDQAFFGDTRQQRCAYLMKTFQKPRYSEDDLKFRSIKVAGPKATVVVGSDISNITSKYTLVEQAGKWRIDAAT